MSMIQMLRRAYRRWARSSLSLRLALFFFLAAALVALLEQLELIQYPSKEIQIISPKPGVVSGLRLPAPVIDVSMPPKAPFSRNAA
jgi:hypothetical protein